MRATLKFIVVLILTWEAKRVLKKWKPFIILVSGSVGKTTTKDAIYHVLKEHGSVRKSEKSFNSEIGVPLTILGLPNAWHNPLVWMRNIRDGYRVTSANTYPDTLVLEVGSDHPGDILRLTSWLTPDIAVVTRLPDVPVHVEYFESPEALRKEDALVVSALRESGVYVGNADDLYALLLVEDTDKRHIRNITFGLNVGATLRATTPTIRYAQEEGIERPVGMQCSVAWENESYPIFINGVLGIQPCMAVLAALAVGIARGQSMVRMTESLIQFESPNGRMRIIAGKNSTTIIDDTYNSSPVAVEAALLTLKECIGKRKIAILGDMLELGSFAEEEHWKAGRLAGAFVDELVTVGARASFVAEAGKSSGLPEACIHAFADATEAGRFVASIMDRGDIILAKGSQGSGKNMIRLERAVKILMENELEASKVLVRQEDEWQKQYKK